MDIPAAELRGPIAFVGGAEFHVEARPIDDWLLARSRSLEVLVIPTAVTDKPRRIARAARRHFASMGGKVRTLSLLDRDDATRSEIIDEIGKADFIYLTGGDPRRLATSLMGTPAWEAIVRANASGAVLAGSSAGAMVLSDAMLVAGADDPVEGLGLFAGLLVVPHFNSWGRNILQISRPNGRKIIGIDESTAVVLDNGSCHVLGWGRARAYAEGEKIWSINAPATIDSELVARVFP